MTTSFDSSPEITNAATFNAYYSGVRAAILSLGWVQLTDEGQVNLATNVTLPASMTYGLFQLFRMNDPLQSESPVILRIGYGHGGYPAMTFQVGRATNGAGEFVGDATPIIPVRASTTSGDPTLYTSFASGSSGRIWIAFNASLKATGVAGSRIMFLAVERSKDVTGADTAEFVTIIASGATDAERRQASLHYTFGPTLPENRWIAPFPFNSESLGFGISGGSIPVFPFLGKVENPLMDVGLGKTANFTHGANITVDSYGVLRTYKVLKSGATNTAFSAGLVPQVSALAGPCILARWE